MNAYATKTCEELHEALAAARAAVEPPRMNMDTDMNDIVRATGPTDPAVTQPDLLKEIEDIQQAMREAGCAEE